MSYSVYQHISETSQIIISTSSCGSRVISLVITPITTMCSAVALLDRSALCVLVTGSELNRQQWSKSYLPISARCKCSEIISGAKLGWTKFRTKSYKHIICLQF